VSCTLFSGTHAEETPSPATGRGDRLEIRNYLAVERMIRVPQDRDAGEAGNEFLE